MSLCLRIKSKTIKKVIIKVRLFLIFLPKYTECKNKKVHFGFKIIKRYDNLCTYSG